MGARLLDRLDDADRRVVLAAARRRRFSRGEVVFHDGDPGDTLHLVLKGYFAIRITTPLGDIATVRVLGPGEHFGELAVVAPGRRHGTVVSLGDGETMGLQRDVLARFRAEMPTVDEALSAALVEEIRRLSLQLVDALYVPADRRVWRRLRELAELYGGETPVVIVLTQDDLAQMAGTTRPTANRVLQSGVEAGVVRLSRGQIEVHDLAGLDRLTG